MGKLEFQHFPSLAFCSGKLLASGFFHVADVCDACEAAARVALVKRVKGKKDVARIGKTEASSSILSPNSSLDREQTLERKTPTCSMYCILDDLRCTASPNYS